MTRPLGGYSLFVKDGKLRYAHKYVGRAVYTVESDQVLQAGKHELRFEFVAAQVDMEDQIIGKLGAVPPDDPADAERGQPELVPGGADRLDPGQPEVENHVGRAERG